MSLTNSARSIVCILRWLTEETKRMLFSWTLRIMSPMVQLSSSMRVTGSNPVGDPVFVVSSVWSWELGAVLPR